MIVICMLATLGAFTVLFAVAWVVREFWRINRGGISRTTVVQPEPSPPTRPERATKASEATPDITHSGGPRRDGGR